MNISIISNRFVERVKAEISYRAGMVEAIFVLGDVKIYPNVYGISLPDGLSDRSA